MIYDKTSDFYPYLIIILSKIPQHRLNQLFSFSSATAYSTTLDNNKILKYTCVAISCRTEEYMQPTLYETRSDAEHHIYFEHSYGGDTPTHFHQALEIVYVIKEKIIVTLNEETHILYPGEIAVIPSYCIHSFRCPAGTEAFVFTIAQNVISKLQEFTMVSFSNFLPKTQFTDEIENWLRLCEEKWRDSNYLMRYSLVYYFIGLLQKYFSTTPQRSEANSLIPEILSYIEEHYAEDLSLKFLSAYFGYSKNYFSTLFNHCVNMHLTEYMNRVRILHAKQDLDDANNTETILQIATKHGFNSLNTFYRALKKYNCQLKSPLT